LLLDDADPRRRDRTRVGRFSMQRLINHNKIHCFSASNGANPSPIVY
jgi:hypothetical protein